MAQMTRTLSRKGRMRLAKGLLATTLLAASATFAQAQDAAGDAPLVLELDTIVVEGSTYETEGTGSYTTDLISVGDKDTRPLREVPQSATVVTRERIEDGNFTSLDSAIRRTPGVVVLTNDDGRSSLYSRGFEFDTIYLNGLSTPIFSIYGSQPDMASVDHIEILRGPAGLFGGASEPGGIINLRLKQASDEFRASLTGTAGSWNQRRIEADVTGPLVESGRVRGRIVGALGARDSWVDEVDNEIGVLYGTIQADITENTTATFSVNHRQREITPTNGLPAYADGTLLDIRRSTYTGADWNDFSSRATEYIAEVEHLFLDGGHAKVSALYARTDADFLYGFTGSAANAQGIVNRFNWLARDYTEDAISLDAHVSKPFTLLGYENNIIAGIDHRRSEATLLNQTGFYTGSFDLYNWNSAIPRPSVTYQPAVVTETDQTGVYGQWRFKPLDDLTLIGGGRFSWYDATTNTETASIEGEFTPYAGIIYDINPALSAYASYTETFFPQTAANARGELFEPRAGHQYEIGLKAELFQNVNATLAYFNLTDKNRVVPDLENPGEFSTQGEARLSGVELEVTGTVLPGWEVAAGYTYTDTEFRNTAGSTAAEFYTPEHMLQLWTKYTFDESHGFLHGAYLGGGVKIFSSFENRIPGRNVRIEAPGYTVVDLQAGYKFNENFNASVTVNNVFDEKYYERVGAPQQFNFYGEPRSAVVKLSATF